MQRPIDIYNELVQSFPDLFEGRDAHPLRSVVPEGWRMLVWRMAERLTNAVRPSGMVVQITQIKEKWGTLRCYTYQRRSGDDTPIDTLVLQEIKEIVSDAIVTSGNTCLFCGASPAHLFQFAGWVATTCEKHGFDGDRLPHLTEEN